MNNVYKNGNTIISIGEDGTKIRYTPDGYKPEPEYPESIDMKITDRCSLACPQCHECSSPIGAHANLNSPLLDSLRPYTELAIGGGDPLSHPGLKNFLVRMQAQKVICNITVHWRTFEANNRLLHDWAEQGLVHGVGVSVNDIIPCGVVDMIEEMPNAVVHTIAGYANKSIFRQMMDRGLNILLLGYKTFGRGEDFIYQYDNYVRISDTQRWISQHLDEFWDHFRAVSFDNLAIEQLNLKNKLKPEVFNRFYMGGDGMFTMYVDLVRNEYAVSSVSPRKEIDSNDIKVLFKDVRRLADR